MKVIKTAAMVVGAVALVATGVGAVVGGAAFLAATGVSLATVSAIGTVAGLVGTVATAISPPKAAKGTIGGQQTDFKLDPNAGIPYLVGRTFAGGNIVHRDTWGTDNQYQGFVVSYSGAGTLQGFESYLVDQTNYGRNGDSVGGTYAGWMWNRLTLPGTPGGPVTSPVAGFPGLDNSFRMSGHATGVVVLKFDVKNGKKFSGGVPKNGIVAVGERVYDPRQDSTWPGGNGPCRARDEATYVGGAAALNPWLHALTWALGRWQNGRRVLGVGQRPQSIDIQTFVDAANVADANGWTIGGVVYSIDNKWDVLRQMAQAGGGQCLRLGARLAAVVNAPKVALATINETDLVGRASVSASQTYRDRLNGMIPKYRSEAHGWEVIPASIVRVASYVQADGEEKTKEWPLPLVQDLRQAGQITAYELVNRREFGPIQLPVFIRFMGYKPGDALNLKVGSLGLVDQMAIVRKRQIDPTSGNVQLSLVSETPDKHPFALGRTSVAPPIPDLSVPDESVVVAPQASDWVATGGELEKDGVKTPAVILAGDVRNPMAEAFAVEIRPADAADWTMVGQYPAKTTRVDITNVAATAAYYVAVSYVRRGVVGERLQLGPVVAGILVSGAAQSLPDDGTIGGVIDVGTGKAEGGRPVKAVLEELVGFKAADEAQKVATDLLAKADLDLVAAQRQIQKAADDVGAALLRLVNEDNRTRTVLRDAGIVVDETSGSVRIYAIDQIANRTSQAEIALDAVKSTITQKASVNYVDAAILAAQLDQGQVADLKAVIQRITTAETAIDGLNAAVALRATLTELTAATGRLSTVETTLDAVQGLVSTKAESATVDQLATQVGSVQQDLQSLGDISGVTLTIRQAVATSDDAAMAALRSIVAGDLAAQRQIVAAAQVKSETYARMDAGLAGEAAQRTALLVQARDIDARLSTEISARITDSSAFAQQISALGVTQGQLSANLTAFNQARIDGDGLNARAISDLSVSNGQLTARTVSLEQVTNDLKGRTEAYIEKRASVPGADAAIVLKAKNDNGVITSNIALIAGKIALQTTEGDVVRGGLSLSGADVLIDGTLTATTAIKVGSGRLKVAVAPTDYQVSDNETIVFGYTFERPPSISFGGAPVGLNPGEVFSPYADVTATGFTAHLQIYSSPVSTPQSTGVFSKTQTGAFEYNISGKPLAFNGEYTLYVGLAAYGRGYSDAETGGGPSGTWSATAAVTYGVYALIQSVWTRIGVQQFLLTGNGTGRPPASFRMEQGDTIRAATSQRVDAFRVVLESTDSGTGGEVTGVSDCRWTSQSSGSSRSATPNGQKVNATMRPVY